MKNKIKGAYKYFFLLSLIVCSKGYAQDLLNPTDVYGKPWFQTQELKNTFFNKLVLKAKNSAAQTGLSKSILNDALIVLIKKDIDFTDNNSNEVYTNLVISKSASAYAESDSYVTQNSVNSTRSPVLVSYLLGANIDLPQISVTEDLPGAPWGAVLVNNTTVLNLKQLNSSTGSWININDSLQIVVENISISGF